jgi:pimeloyl-ACP methyl ester carboxylesterase
MWYILRVRSTIGTQVKERVGARATILVGHSMGCRVIVEAFLQSPSGVAGLVFVDGSIIGGDPETGVQRARESISRGGMDALTQRLFTDMFIEGSDPALRDRLVARAMRVDPAFREELFVDLVRWDLTKAREAYGSGSRAPVDVYRLQSQARADANGNDDSVDGCDRELRGKVGGEDRVGRRPFRHDRGGADRQRGDWQVRRAGRLERRIARLAFSRATPSTLGWHPLYCRG